MVAGVMYFVGVLLHVGVKWSTWKTQQKDAGWMSYWRDNLALNIQAGITAVVCFVIWEQHLFSRLANATLGDAANIPELEVTAWSSLFAGYLFDSVGRNIIVAIENKIKGRAKAIAPEEKP